MPTRRAFVLLAALFVSGFGCASSDERLWYKPGGNYTTAEFNQDRDACTRVKKLDEECLKAKGWVSVNPDRPAPAAPPRPGRY
ncbi:MAG: hypothetical protein WAP47_15185 [Candidatus Rokuibacteriota bacterium]